jgi:hypothetical protein
MLFLLLVIYASYYIILYYILVIPKHNSTFKGIKSIGLSNFLEMGSLAGAATTLH